MKKSFALNVLLTTLIAGTLDIIAAKLSSGATFFVIGQYISSAAVGREAAFSGGMPMAVLGMAFHYFIAFSWTIIFFLLYPRISALRSNVFIVGLLYGVVVWIVMNLVVLRLSQLPSPELTVSGVLRGMAILMTMIGLPIALMAKRYYGGGARSQAVA